MREMGASEDELEQLLDQEVEPEPFEVMPDNWDAIQLYLSVYGQFTISENGHVFGFNFAAVDVDIERSGIEVTPQTWQRFKILAHHTVHTLNQRDGK
jgi:hypothetical protein